MQTPAWRIENTGSPSVFQRSSITLPAITSTQVLIEVVAVGFNPVDTKIRAGLAPIAPDHGVLGSDVAGLVLEVGNAVTQFQKGDAVFGCAGGVRGHGGALAKYMVAEAALLAHAPKSIELSQAAGLPIPAITAQHLKRRLQLQAGDDVCVLGASGAVGQLVTQLALLAGCQVMGTGGSPTRLKPLKDLGIQACLHNDIGTDGASYSKVIDTHGGVALLKALQLAKPYGQVATINARGQHDFGLAHAKALSFHAIFMLLPLLQRQDMESCGADLADIAKRIDEGSLQALPINKVAMSEVAQVHEQYEHGDLNIKTVMVADW